MYRSILVPLDGSPLSEHAIPVASDLARRSGALLRLVHVHVLYTARGIEQRAWETLRQQAEIYLAAASRPNVLGMSGGHA